MNEKKFVENTLDAFIALRDIPDEDVSDMLTEGKSFTIRDSQAAMDARDYFDKEVASESESELVVVDPNMDAVDHAAEKEKYLGQAILKCVKCQNNMFVDTDKLEDSDEEFDGEKVYNLEMECPTCHATEGFTLVGQVAKYEDEPEEEEAPEESEEDSEEATAENDEATGEDEATFENDEEEAEEGSEENSEEELDDDLSWLFDEEEEDDGMETTASEDDDLPEEKPERDENETDADDTDEDDEEKAKKIKKESLTEALSENASEAWLMNKVISSLNNEDAYYESGWLELWPDGETEEYCEYDFRDPSAFNELKELFEEVYLKYRQDGLYNADEETINYAHKIDNLLGLRPIDNFVDEPEEVREALKHNTCGELVECFIGDDPNIVVCDSKGDDCRELYHGCYSELPDELKSKECTGFNTDGDLLVCNVFTDDNGGTCLRDILSKLQNCDNVSVCGANTSDELYSGDVQGAIDGYGDYKLASLETPKLIVLNVSAPECEPIDDTVDPLVLKILNKNGLSSRKLNNPYSEESTIADAINDKEDLDYVYKKYIVPVDDGRLSEQFKAATGYQDAIDRAITETYGAKSVKSVKTRKALAEAIADCKNNNRPYSIKRSLNESARYDIITEGNFAFPGDDDFDFEPDDDYEPAADVDDEIDDTFDEDTDDNKLSDEQWAAKQNNYVVEIRDLINENWEFITEVYGDNPTREQVYEYMEEIMDSIYGNEREWDWYREDLEPAIDRVLGHDKHLVTEAYDPSIFNPADVADDDATIQMDLQDEIDDEVAELNFQNQLEDDDELDLTADDVLADEVEDDRYSRLKNWRDRRLANATRRDEVRRARAEAAEAELNRLDAEEPIEVLDDEALVNEELDEDANDPTLAELVAEREKNESVDANTPLDQILSEDVDDNEPCPVCGKSPCICENLFTDVEPTFDAAAFDDDVNDYFQNEVENVEGKYITESYQTVGKNIKLNGKLGQTPIEFILESRQDGSYKVSSDLFVESFEYRK